MATIPLLGGLGQGCCDGSCIDVLDADVLSILTLA